MYWQGFLTIIFKMGIWGLRGEVQFLGMRGLGFGVPSYLVLGRNENGDGTHGI